MCLLPFRKGEVLKFGAQIVDALVDYKQPVFIYIPPEGELRGSSWVVVDPAINPDVMEMYADQAWHVWLCAMRGHCGMG